MNALKKIGAAAIATLCFTLASPAKADLTIIEKISMDFSNAKLMGNPFPPGQAKAATSMLSNSMGDTTVYISGKKVKSTNAIVTTIKNYETNKTYLLNPAAKTYSLMSTAASNSPNPDTKISAAIIAGITSSLLKGTNTSTRDLKQTKTFLGYKAHLVKTSMTSPSLTITSYIWLTDELNEAEAANQAKTAGATPHGFPLKMTMQISMGQLLSGLSTTITADSISKDPIPPSTFEIPADYKEISADKINLIIPIGTPGAGTATPGAAPTAPAPLTQPDTAPPAPNAK
jgi:hypothetical protein